MVVVHSKFNSHWSRYVNTLEYFQDKHMVSLCMCMCVCVCDCMLWFQVSLLLPIETSWIQNWHIRVFPHFLTLCIIFFQEVKSLYRSTTIQFACAHTWFSPTYAYSSDTLQTSCTVCTSMWQVVVGSFTIPVPTRPQEQIIFLIIMIHGQLCRAY